MDKVHTVINMVDIIKKKLGKYDNQPMDDDLIKRMRNTVETINVMYGTDFTLEYVDGMITVDSKLCEHINETLTYENLQYYVESNSQDMLYNSYILMNRCVDRNKNKYNLALYNSGEDCVLYITFLPITEWGI